MAKKFNCQNVSRLIVMGINLVFLLLGIAMLVVGIVGLQKVMNVTNQADVLNQFDLKNIMIVILASGCGTIFTSILGFVGAWIRIENLLKIYASIVFIVVCIQIGMGGYILNLNIDSLSSTWYEETTAGQQRRESYQNYMNCCGWNTWYDSIGQLATPCPNNLLPTLTNPSLPTTCRQATIDFLHTYMNAIAAAAITIAVLELVALIATFFVIFDGKRRNVETGFEY